MVAPTLTWRDTPTGRAPFARTGKHEVRAVWAPQRGGQIQFITRPLQIQECLAVGERGGGKTETLLMDFRQYVGMGFNEAWRGIILRRTYKQLDDVIKKARKWLPRFKNPGTFKASGSQLKWVWPTGEELLFRVFKRAEDYDEYHGQEFSWILWEELTKWADDIGYRRMFSCVRAATSAATLPDGRTIFMPRRINATTNPSGVGHNFVRQRWQLPQMIGRVIPGEYDEELGFRMPDRTSVHMRFDDNLVLKQADPHYQARVSMSARNAAERAAWLYNDWDIVSGGMFDDLWDSTKHIVPTFQIPHGWRIDRAFDWGSSRPFAVIWFAESDGSPVTFDTGRTMQTLPGDLFAVREWYGWNGTPNEGLRMTAGQIADGIKQREKEWFPGRVVYAGPADASIFGTENGVSIAVDMKNRGVRWEPSNKSAGSRKNGWNRIRELLAGVIPEEGHPREDTGLFVCDSCQQGIRLIPSTPRSDKDPDDVDTESEDHCLHGDTIVYTPDGPRPIAELAGTSGIVWTPYGWQEYHGCRMTRRDTGCIVLTDDCGTQYVMTPDHQVASPDGWVDAENIRRIVTCRIPSSSVRQSKSLTGSGTTSAGSISREGACGCIGWSGRRHTERYRAAITSTIGTTIGATTGSQILSLRQPTITCRSTAMSLSESRNRSSTLSERRLQPRNGTRATPDVSGIDSITRMSDSTCFIRQQRSSAIIAARHTRQSLMVDTAPDTARRLRDELLASIMSSGNASSAAKCSRSIDTTRINAARDHAAQNCVGRIVDVRSAGNHDVYCMTVPATGCFIVGDGLLVSNCQDALRYRCYQKRGELVETQISGR